MMKTKRKLAIVAAVLIAFVGGMVAAHAIPTSSAIVGEKRPSSESVDDQGPRVATSDARALARGLSAVFEEAAAEVSPSVVPVFSEHTVDVPDGFGSIMSPFGRFFGDNFFQGQVPQAPNGGHETVHGLGSGVIVRSDGYILTNNHVVDGADKVTVMLSQEKKLDAKVIGRDAQTDLAVIKVDATDLHAARIGDSDNVSVGEWVIAVGNPFQLMHTVTTGIISATGRSSVGLADYEDFIQTDASINPGNSGGALADLDGNVVGINTAISSPSGGNVGIGFAIPINMATTIMDALIEKGHVSRGYLGVMLQDVDAALARGLGLDGAAGVVVAEVTPGGPADKAGIRRGDVLREIDGRPLEDVVQVRNQVANAGPGAREQIGLIRNGKSMKVEVTLDERPEQLSQAGDTAERGQQQNAKLGLGFQTLTPELARQLGYREIDGVLVSSVLPGSPADEAGIQRGDLILEVSKTPVSTAEQFVQLLSVMRSGDSLALLLRRGSSTFYVGLVLE